MLTISGLTIIPRGTLVQRMNVLVGARIAAGELKCPLSVVWDHAIPYSDLFMNSMSLVTMDEVSKDRYVYNPHMDPNYLLNNAQFSENGVTLVLETSECVRIYSHSYMQYALKKKAIYHDLLKDHINGWFLGQINLIDIPKRPIVGKLGNDVNNEVVKANSKPAQKHTVNFISFDCEDLQDVNQELLEYIHTIVLSKSDLVVCYDKKYVGVAVEASSISLCPLLIFDENVDFTLLRFYESALMKNPYAIDNCYALHPDVNRLSICLML